METGQQVGQLMMMGKPPLTGESDREVLALLGAGNAFKPQLFSLTHLLQSSGIHSNALSDGERGSKEGLTGKANFSACVTTAMP